MAETMTCQRSWQRLRQTMPDHDRLMSCQGIWQWQWQCQLQWWWQWQWQILEAWDHCDTAVISDCHGCRSTNDDITIPDKESAWYDTATFPKMGFTWKFVDGIYLTICGWDLPDNLWIALKRTDSELNHCVTRVGWKQTVSMFEFKRAKQETVM